VLATGLGFTVALVTQAVVLFLIVLCTALYNTWACIPTIEIAQGPVSRGPQVLRLYRACCISVCLGSMGLIFGISRPWELAVFLSFWARLGTDLSNLRRPLILCESLGARPIRGYMGLWLVVIPLGKLIYHVFFCHDTTYPHRGHHLFLTL